MKTVFDKYKYEIVNQGGVNLVVAGYSNDHVIGATKEEEKHAWSKYDLDSSSYVLPQFEDKCNYIYISEELLRFKPTNDE